MYDPFHLSANLLDVEAIKAERFSRMMRDCIPCFYCNGVGMKARFVLTDSTPATHFCGHCGGTGFFNREG